MFQQTSEEPADTPLSRADIHPSSLCVQSSDFSFDYVKEFNGLNLVAQDKNASAVRSSYFKTSIFINIPALLQE